MSMLSSGLGLARRFAGGIITSTLPGGIGGILAGIIGGRPTFGGFGGGGVRPPSRDPYVGGIPTPGQVTGTGPGTFFGGKVTQCPRGYHLNKKPLGPSKRHGAVPARSMCVRNRSINPMNYRALTRSLRRIKRASKIVRKLHKFNAPGIRSPARRLSPATAVLIPEQHRLTAGRS